MAAKSAQQPRELFLLDGNSLAYRAFFALPESIATSDGRPTNAIFGFASMLVKLITDHHPAGVIVAWDAGMSGREQTYPEYKAQRSSRPDLLREQWPHLVPLVEAFGYPNVRVEGWEADDVIASLTRQAQEQGIPVMVVTGDRDAYQLVGDGVRVMTTSRGITDTRVYDRDGVIERYGVPPELVTDLIGLKGDTSDNIPGVPGIGDKTAAQLLQEYGSLEAVLENVDKISGAKRKQNLTEHADDARVSKELAKLQFDVETGHRRRLGDGRRARPRGPARVRPRVRAAGGDGAARGGPARGRGRARPRASRPSSRSRRSRASPPTSGRGRWRWRSRAASGRGPTGERVVHGETSHAELVAASAAAPSSATTSSRWAAGATACSPPPPREGTELAIDHDTVLGAYLLDPARRTTTWSSWRPTPASRVRARRGVPATASWSWARRPSRRSTRRGRRASSTSSPPASAT